MDGAKAKGGSRRKPSPPDFADVFIREGWRGVEAEFGAHTRCNKRWVEDNGGDALKLKRREFLRERSALRRAQAQAVQEAKRQRIAKAKNVPLSPELERAIAFLKSREGGAWLITPTGRGDFFFGGTRLPAEQIIARAEGRRGRWSSWSQPERQALEDFSHAPMETIRAALPDRSENQIRCMARNLGYRRGEITQLPVRSGTYDRG